MRWIPNAVSLFRLLLSVPLAFALWNGRTAIALWLAALASISDLADGFLAREFNWRSRIGSWIDPAADKTIITTVLVVLTAKGILPVWFCWLTVGRDIILVSGILTLVSMGFEVRIRPFLAGKLATAAQNLTLLAGITSQMIDVGHVLPTLTGVSALLTVLSAYTYGRALGRILRSGQRTAQEG